CFRRSVGYVIGVILGDIARRTLQALRIPVPDAADVPPPAIAPVVDLMPPTSAFPGEMAVIGMAGEMVHWQRSAADDMRVRAGRHARAHRPGSRVRSPGSNHRTGTGLFRCPRRRGGARR